MEPALIDEESDSRVSPHAREPRVDSSHFRVLGATFMGGWFVLALVNSVVRIALTAHHEVEQGNPTQLPIWASLIRALWILSSLPLLLSALIIGWMGLRRSFRAAGWRRMALSLACPVAAYFALFTTRFGVGSIMECLATTAVVGVCLFFPRDSSLG